MEEIEIQKNNTEKLINTEKESEVFLPIDSNQLESEIKEISNQIKTNEETIIVTTQQVNNVRHELYLEGQENNIPSIVSNKEKIINFNSRKIELENKLSEILKSDLSFKYQDTINEVKQSKIEWANSSELARRLKQKGLDDDDLSKVKDWLFNNVNNTKSFILTPDKFKETLDILSEMTGDDYIKEGSAFHATDREDIPENIRNSIFMKEMPAKPAIPGSNYISENHINKTTLSHELGHAAQDGLLEAEQFKDNWNPKFKDGAPDKEYVGLIQETDTRIRSMLNTLGDSLNIEKEIFGKKHLDILRDKMKTNSLDKDTKDLLEHYDDGEIIKMANRMPAI